MAKRRAVKSGKKPREVKGKSQTNMRESPVWKPSIWLDDKQIPKELKDAKPGTKVEMTVVGKVVSKSEHLDGGSMSIEFEKMAATKKGKK